MLARRSPDWRRGVAVPAGILIQPPLSNPRSSERRAREGRHAHGAPRVRPQPRGVLDRRGIGRRWGGAVRRLLLGAWSRGRVLFRPPAPAGRTGGVERATSGHPP